MFSESLSITLAFGCLDSPLICSKIATVGLSLASGLIVIGEVEVDASPTMHFLPNPSPRGIGSSSCGADGPFASC